MSKAQEPIAEFLAHFENRKHNLAFDVQDGTGYIYLVTDGLQMAQVAKMLLLKGKSKLFRIKIYEDKGSLQEVVKKRPKTKSQISRRTSDT